MEMSCKLSSENAVSRLTELYEKHGYGKFKMSKFEEYDLYVENKSFLKSTDIITFSDLNGRLLALKPDVTLSIAKNVRNRSQMPYKLYYNENVYRVGRGTKEYKEITQVGLEYIGDVDLYSAYEVLSLAVKSLQAVGGGYILDISHIGFINGILDETTLTAFQRERVIELIAERNTHELRAFCLDCSVNNEISEKITALSGIYGSFDSVIPFAEGLVMNDRMNEALVELKALYELIQSFNSDSCINIDFSIVNDISYYNGIIFQGFIEGVPAAVLSGGRYDNLLKKLGKDAQAIGFAVYTDILDSYYTPEKPYDVECALLYNDKDDVKSIIREVQRLSQTAGSIRVQQTLPKDYSANKYFRMIDGEAVEFEADA